MIRPHKPNLLAEARRRFPTKWDSKVIRDRAQTQIKSWGSVWTHASESQRMAFVLECAWSFLTCRDDVEYSGLDARNLQSQILLFAGLLDSEVMP